MHCTNRACFVHILLQLVERTQEESNDDANDDLVDLK